MEIVKKVWAIALALALLAGAANAATGSSGEFRIDLRGMGPWERRVARPTEAISYSSAWATNAPADAKAVVKVYPCLKEKPTYIAIDLSGGTNATHYPVEYFNEIPGGSWSDEYKTSKLVLRHIPAGSFIMGGRNTDYPGAVNTNLHMVTITRDFYMGVFEVTQRQWELVMGNRPSIFSNDMYYASRPVECVKWIQVRGRKGIEWPSGKSVDDCSFMGVLRRKTCIHGFDLPTEAQWEYACRSGTTTALNNGRNLSGKASCPDFDSVGRSRQNGGDWEKDGLAKSDWVHIHSNDDTSKGTMVVGAYSPNARGLYDMHGNVAEWCLDVFSQIAEGGVDPRGPEGEGNAVRIYRGGGWWHSASGCIASERTIGDTRQDGGWTYYTTNGWPSVGFRLCLQGGEVYDAEGLTLVDATGTGLADWMPSATGTYYLTHEVMNGVTNVSLMSVCFEVPGPTLTFTPDGELAKGVGIAIDGATDGWQIYYTTDGTAPTTNAVAYTGAITLNETTTVRAVAYNAQGVRSEEASATFSLHDALGIASAVAKPRYPWNGKVDVDVELKGDPSLTYLVSLEALDLLGGTNLPVRTVVCTRPTPQTAASIVQPSTFNLQPGSHRLTWDAAADITGDYDFARVAVTVKATGSHLLAYPKTLELTVAGYTGTETLTNVPTLVRLSTAIPGFSYDDFATTNGADLAFFDANEKPLPYEIDEWNPNGESLVWVRLPALANGTRFTAAWGKLSTFNVQPSTSVWADYAGVWHMNEPSGTAFDSTEHHLDGIPSCGTNALADVSQMVAYANGACGRARISSVYCEGQGTYMTVPAYDGLHLADVFSIQGWVSLREVQGCPRLFCRKDVYSQRGGWDVAFKDTAITNGVMGANNSADIPAHYVEIPSAENRWVSYLYQFDNDRVCCYTNGVMCGTVPVSPATDNGKCLAFGNTPTCREHSLNGQYDEIRLRGGSLSADRIKADYDMIANQKFLSYGAVRSGYEEVVE